MSDTSVRETVQHAEQEKGRTRDLGPETGGANSQKRCRSFNYTDLPNLAIGPLFWVSQTFRCMSVLVLAEHPQSSVHRELASACMAITTFRLAVSSAFANRLRLGNPDFGSAPLNRLSRCARESYAGIPQHLTRLNCGLSSSKIAGNRADNEGARDGGNLNVFRELEEIAFSRDGDSRFRT
jgi:hypothetical protein